MVGSELWRLTASEMASGIANGSLSSVEVTKACLERIEHVNPTLNAVVALNADESLAMAEAADKAVRAGDPLGPLHGVPVSTKINSDQEGFATDDGVVAFKENVAEADSPQIAMLRKAGAVLLGRTNSPAFHFRWFSENDLHGRTLNPWGKSLTPGGSSGGASSSVASGMLPLAHGNDIGGSVRYPAYACGIVGLRPTVGRVPNVAGPPDQDSPFSAQVMQAQGPLARSVNDIRLAVDAMTGFAPEDPFSVPTARIGDTAPSRRPIKVGVVRESDVVTPEPAVLNAVDQAAGFLRDAGYVVEELRLPMLEEAFRLWYLLVMEEFRQIMPLVEEVGDDGMRLAAKAYYAAAREWWGDHPDRETYMAGYARRGTLIAQLQAVMAEHPVVLMPVSAELPFEHNDDISSVERGVDVVHAQWSMMGIPLVGFPALSVPTGTVNGVPVGVQLLGQRFGEADILDAAAVVEHHAGVLTPVNPR